MFKQNKIFIGVAAVLLLFVVIVFGFRSGKYDQQEEFVRGFAVVSKNGKFGMINESGQEIVPPQYESVSYFIGSFAKIKENGKFGFIDKTGKVVIAPKYDQIYGYNGEYAKVILNGKVGLIDKEAREVIAPQYDAVSYNIIGDYFEVARNGQVSKLSKSEVSPRS
ncbi:MAG: WG repeat-containing protein [Microscillaceae bacterium]|nr:WG repeat-containing protein [Microscillaceae bacterium]